MFTKADYENLKTPAVEEIETLMEDIAAFLVEHHSQEDQNKHCCICETRHAMASSAVMAVMSTKILAKVLVSGDINLYIGQLGMMFVMGQLFQQKQAGTFNEVEVLERMFKNSTGKS